MGTINKSKYEKSNFSEGSHHSKELLAMGNGGGKLEKCETMENATTPIGKPLFNKRITMVEIVANFKHQVCKLTKLCEN